jgi:hypothetical protein
VRDFITGSAADAVMLGKKLAQSLWRNGADKILGNQQSTINNQQLTIDN